MYKTKVMENICKSVLALYMVLYYDGVVQIDVNNKDKFMHLNENFVKDTL